MTSMVMVRMENSLSKKEML